VLLTNSKGNPLKHVFGLGIGTSRSNWELNQEVTGRRYEKFDLKLICYYGTVWCCVALVNYPVMWPELWLYLPKFVFQKCRPAQEFPDRNILNIGLNIVIHTNIVINIIIIIGYALWLRIIPNIKRSSIFRMRKREKRGFHKIAKMMSISRESCKQK
jgi:hypothetical protein